VQHDQLTAHGVEPWLRPALGSAAIKAEHDLWLQHRE
jgi:hypothetical protein